MARPRALLEQSVGAHLAAKAKSPAGSEDRDTAATGHGGVALVRFCIAPTPQPSPPRQELVSGISHWPRERGRIWMGPGTQGGGRG